jgi:TonB family protein
MMASAFSIQADSHDDADAVYAAYQRHLALFEAGQYDEAVDQLGEAYRLGISVLPEHDEDVANLAFNYGAGLMWAQRTGAAIPVLEDALHRFEALNLGDESLKAAHTYLVHAFEITGQSDNATEHCLAIGRLLSGETETDSVPLYLPMARLGPALKHARKPLTVVFTVDSSGFTRNLEVVGESPHPALMHAALDTVGEFRFAPAFRAETAVAQNDVEYTFHFDEIRAQIEQGRMVEMPSLQPDSVRAPVGQGAWNRTCPFGGHC